MLNLVYPKPQQSNMEDKLQLHELAGYLPYGLKCQYEGILNGQELKAHSIDASCTLLEMGEFYRRNPRPDEIKGMKVAPIKDVKIFNDYWKAYIGIYRIGLKGFINGDGFKPILRPMSDLRNLSLKWREIAMEQTICNNDEYMVMKDFNQTQTISWNMAQWLYRNHFDIHNLIGRGLAIDINTLKD